MAVELYVNGCFEVTFFDTLTREEVSKETEKEILENLKNGTYVFGMNSKTVFNLEDWIPMYSTDIEGTDAMNYEWEAF